MVKSRGDRRMTKQEQVKQMAKERSEIKDIMKLLDRCGSLNPMCKADVATIVYGNNYRKIPEGSVVLTQDELNDKNHFAQRFGYDLGSKETAEKIIHLVGMIPIPRQVSNRYGVGFENALTVVKLEIAKQFGVEIKE